MFPDPSIRWEPVPSIVDGLKNPHVTPVDADTAQYFSCVISGDNDEMARRRREERVFSAVVRPEAFFGIGEVLYSALTPEDDGGVYDGGVWLKETHRSSLLNVLRDDPFRRQLFRHFLLVGGNTCFEVVAHEPPEFAEHSGWEEAIGYLREKGGRV